MSGPVNSIRTSLFWLKHLPQVGRGNSASNPGLTLRSGVFDRAEGADRRHERFEESSQFPQRAEFIRGGEDRTDQLVGIEPCEFVS
jgi:hypothetical protein